MSMRKAIIALSFAAASVAAAQSTESPIPFDSAQRVIAVTPAVAARLQLSSPFWPVAGEYREARLYSIDPGGGFVLVVQLSSGALQRFPLTADERHSLGFAIDAAMRASGRPSAEAMSEFVSEPAGNAFARHQTFLAAVVYAPLAASLADDGAAAGGLYLATTGLTFFISYGSAQNTPFTRAQSDLAGSLGLSAAAGGLLVGYSVTGNADKGVRAIALGSAIAGTASGVALGRRLSDAEVHAAALGIETAAVTAVTAAGIVGTDSRSIALAAAIGGSVGYPLGVRYPRRASYTVTAGDVEATSTAGLAGILAGGAVVASLDHPSSAQYATFLGGGYLAGVALGDLTIARRYDLTQAQANVVNVGALAGALLGLAVPVLTDASDSPLPYAVAAGGAVLGMAAIASTFPKAGSRLALGQASARGYQPAKRGVHFAFTPGGLAGVVSKAPGRHVLARLTF
jgi:hypothetical protein